MAERTWRPSPPGSVQRSLEEKTVAERAADLSEQVLDSVEARQRAAIEALRKFIDRLDDAMPNLGDDPSVRKKVVDAIGDYYEQLATTQYEFLRSVVRSGSGMVSKSGDAKDLYEFLRSFVRSASGMVNERAAKPAPKRAAKPAPKRVAKTATNRAKRTAKPAAKRAAKPAAD